MSFSSKTFVLHLGSPEELDKKSSTGEEPRPSALQKHSSFRPTLQDPQDREQKFLKQNLISPSDFDLGEMRRGSLLI